MYGRHLKLESSGEVIERTLVRGVDGPFGHGLNEAEAKAFAGEQ